MITVYLAKKVITMDQGWPEAQAVAVQNDTGRVVSVGSLEELQPWLSQNQHTIDKSFADKILMPGFVEPHAHPIIGGTALTRPLLTYVPEPNPYGPGFPGVKTPAEALAKLREYAAAWKDPDKTLLAWGYDLTAMGQHHLDKTALDAISETIPIIVWEASEHFVYANSVALKKYGISKADLAIDGIKAGADGEPNGQFLGTPAAQRMLAEPVKKIMATEALTNVQYLVDLSRQHGITTTSELAFGIIDLEMELAVLSKFFNAPDSPMRLVAITDAATMTHNKGEKAIDFVKQLPSKNTDKLIFNGVKFFSDDAFLSLGMAMENPGYIDHHCGFFVTPREKMVEHWLPWWKAGFHIHVHTNGNAGNEATVTALSGLMKEFPRADHRFTCDHFGISTPEQVRRLKALGGLASINPYYLYHRSELLAPYIGSDRAYTAARLKTLTDEGVITALHTDTPVAPPCPLESVWIAVNRFGLSGEVRGPAERITLDQALRMVTIDAAYALGIEEKVGSIATGKFADFVVLEQDPYATAKEELRNIKVWGTVVGGKVYPASEIKAPAAS